METPNYRVEIKIYDADTGEVVTKEDNALFENEEEIVAQAHRVQERFNDTEREGYEETLNDKHIEYGQDSLS